MGIIPAAWAGLTHNFITNIHLSHRESMEMMKPSAKLKTTRENSKKDGTARGWVIFKMVLLIGIPVLVVVLLVYLGSGNRISDSWWY